MGRLIDADALLSEMEKYSDPTAREKNEYLFGMQQRLETCIELVDDAPTVDAVPVIRCGFCRYYDSIGYCALHQTEMNETDFCSYGKKDSDHAEGIVQKERS
jgi:hypothetical protein